MTAEFAAVLRRHRKRSGLTQQELADKAGISVAAVRDLEQARSRRPRARSIRALAGALGLSPAQLPAPARPSSPEAPPEPDGTVLIGVLGPLTVHRGRTPARLGSGRHRAVLARLALTPNTAVYIDELVDLLWAQDVPASSRNLIQTYVSRLRRILDPHMLVLVHSGYRLDAGPEQLDLLRFRELAARGNASGLDLALGLWRGDTDVDELRGSPLLTGLHDEHLAAAVEHARLTEDRPEPAIQRLRALARQHRLHEPLRARLIIALAASGRQAEALASYAEIRRDLADELGIDPSPELAEAHLGVLRQRWQRPIARQAPPDEAAQSRLLDWYLARTAGALNLIYPDMVRLPADLVDETAFAGEDAALSWLDDELPAIVAAVQATGGARAWQIADQLRGYFLVRRHSQPWLATAEAGLAAARASGDARAQAAMHQTLGQARWALGRPAEALAEYLHGEALAESSGWLLGATYLRHNIGLVQAELGRLADAQESYRQALQLSRQYGFGHVQALTLNDLGTMCQQQGRLEEAAEYLTEALRLNQGATRIKPALANLNNLGMVLRQLGRFQAANEYLQRAFFEYRRIADEHGELAVLDELSQLHAHQGEHEAAVSAARHGLDLTRIVRDQRAESALLCTLGEALLGAGDFDEARQQFEESHELAMRHSYRYFQTRSWIGLALARLAAGDADAAYDGARLALDGARAGGYRLLEADALLALARAHLAAGRTQETARCREAALALYRASGSPLRLRELSA